jgi:hypothetical protein
MLLIYGDETMLHNLVANHGLRPTASATTVRAPGGKASVLNGPFAETKEQLAADLKCLPSARTYSLSKRK